MSFLVGGAGNTYRNPPISNVTVNQNTVSFKNAHGKHKVELNSSAERKRFINWLLS